MKGTRQRNAGNQSERETADAAAASRWFHRLPDADASNRATTELAERSERSAEKACVERGRLWEALGPAASESGARPTDLEIAADRYDCERQSISEWLALSPSKRKRWQHSRTTTLLATAAGIAAIICLLLTYGASYYLPLREQVQSFATATSEHRTVELADGSRITIGARTQLTVHYTARRRLIFLDRGEASFLVVHMASRPFTVFAGSGSITALGTEFDVRRELDTTDTERVVVTVSSGSVEVGPPKEIADVSSKGSSDSSDHAGTPTQRRSRSSYWSAARLVKGQELTFGTDGPQGNIETVDLEQTSAWKEGRLEYRHSPFREVIPQVNRYSQKRIILANDGVADLVYGGSVFEGQVKDWLRALQATYPIRVTETADYYVLYYDRAREATLE